jgi:rare lipoprotein A
MIVASKTMAVAALVLGGACAVLSGAEAKSVQSGGASWYGPGFHGRRTASGERFNSRALTAAHRSLPFGSRVRVTNERTGRSVVVRINDRGPFVGGRVIDLSKAAAQAVGISGVGKVKLSRL